MRTINITVRDKLPVVTAMSGSAVMDNKYKLLFDFDDEWQNGLKSVVVVGNRGQYVVYPTETNEVEIELGDARHVSVGVIQDVVATSRPCQIIAEESIKRRMGVEIAPPEQDVWTYITEQIRLLNAAKLSPVTKTATMTQPVGRDEQGRLWTAPTTAGGGSDGSGSCLPAITAEDEGRVLTAEGGLPVWKDLPRYDGAYSVTPSSGSAQTLETAQKYMDSDVRVEKIPYYETENTSGGTTIYIGSDDELITE